MVASTQTAKPVAASPNGERPEQVIPAPEAPAMVRNLYQRLRDVRLALGGTIPKGGTAPAVMGGYPFVSWDDTADRIGTLLAEHGVMVIPEMPDAEVVHVGNSSKGSPIYRATTSMEFEIVNVDNPSDRIIKRWKGQGDDGGDKALQKGCTSAEKYFLLKLFLLGGVGADDADANGTDSRVGAPAAAPARNGGTSGGSRRKVDLPGQRCPECGDQLQAIYNPDPAKRPFVGHRTYWREGACPWRPDFASGARMIAALEQAAPAPEADGEVEVTAREKPLVLLGRPANVADASQAVTEAPRALREEVVTAIAKSGVVPRDSVGAVLKEAGAAKLNAVKGLSDDRLLFATHTLTAAYCEAVRAGDVDPDEIPF